MAALWIVILVYTVLAIFLALGLWKWDRKRAERESKVYDQLMETNPDSKSLSDEAHLRKVLQLTFPLEKYAEDAEVREKLEHVLSSVSAQVERNEKEN